MESIGREFTIVPLSGWRKKMRGTRKFFQVIFVLLLKIEGCCVVSVFKTSFLTRHYKKGRGGA